MRSELLTRERFYPSSWIPMAKGSQTNALILASSVAESSDEHAYVAPHLFTAETPLGTYQGITDQVIMSRSFRTVLVPRGSTALSNDRQPGQLFAPDKECS